jgi:hypothetical protein
MPSTTIELAGIGPGTTGAEKSSRRVLGIPAV